MWRYNPKKDSTSALWFVGGSFAFLAALALMVSRSASAAPAPAPTPTPTPPTPTPRPIPPSRPPTLIRQGTITDPASSSAIRILQRQLKELGYPIVNVDGREHPDTMAAIEEFARDAGVTPPYGPLSIELLVDRRYAEVFDPARWDVA